MNVQHHISDFIQTYTGRKFFPMQPCAEDVNIHDIAHALSNLCRYAGHCEYFYSVAQHSYFVSFEVPKEHALTALMHDATEAYCVDVPRPLKKYLTNYAEIEHGIWQAVATRYGLPIIMPECVHWADNAVLLAEKEQIMKESAPWSISGDPARILIQKWTPQFAEEMFLQRFKELTDAMSYRAFLKATLGPMAKH